MFTEKEHKLLDEEADYIKEGAMVELIELIKKHKREYRTKGEDDELKYIELCGIETMPPSTEIRFGTGEKTVVFDAGAYDSNCFNYYFDDSVW